MIGIVTFKLKGDAPCAFTFPAGVEHIRDRLDRAKATYRKNVERLKHDKGFIQNLAAKAVHSISEKLGFATPPSDEVWKKAQSELELANGFFLCGDDRRAELMLKAAVINYNSYVMGVNDYFEAVGAGAEGGKLVTEIAITALTAVATGGFAGLLKTGVAGGAAISGALSGGTALAQQGGEKWFGIRNKIDVTKIGGQALVSFLGSLTGGLLSKLFLSRLSGAWSKVWEWKKAGCPGGFEGWVLKPRVLPGALGKTIKDWEGFSSAAKLLGQAERERMVADYLIRQGVKFLENIMQAAVAGTADKVVPLEFLLKSMISQLTKMKVQAGFAEYLRTAGQRAA